MSEITQDYLRAVVNRNSVSMLPAGFDVDWADKPRSWKSYRGVPRTQLPDGAGVADRADLAELLGDQGPGTLAAPPLPGAASPGPPAAFDLDLVAGMLRYSYGLLSRRLAVNGNTDPALISRVEGTQWGRGSASGGGLYPVAVYWAAGKSGPLVPGVYFYDPAHHALQRLLTGDVTADVRGALADSQAAAGTDQFLILALKFWQNSFKYNNFSYHATTMDTGTLVHAWDLYAGERGRSVETLLWFDEERLCSLLGTTPDQEAVFAVVPLPWAGTPEGSDPGPAAVRRDQHRSGPRVTVVENERSRRLIAFEQLAAVQRAALVGSAARPEPADPSATVSQGVAGAAAQILPTPAPVPGSARAALLARRSSFGRFSAGRPLGGAELHRVLAAGTAAGTRRTDLSAPSGAASWLTMYLFANHVEDVLPGAYAFQAGPGGLAVIRQDDQSEFLQDTYNLDNYNVEQSAAVVVPAIRVAELIDAYGGAGYRLANHLAGACAQAVYTACAAMGLGCGAVLGFDPAAYIERLGIAASGEIPMLAVMVGRERDGAADFRFDFV